MLAANAGLAKKLAALEAKYDKQFNVIFVAIRQLMTEGHKEDLHPPATSPGRVQAALV